MKILITLPYTNGRGGIETVVTELLNSSFSTKNDITLLIQSNQYSDWLNNLPKQVTVAKCFRDGKKGIDRMGSYLWQILMHKDFDYVIDVGVRSLTFLKKIRKLLHKKYKIISWPHFSLSIYKDKEEHFKSADYYWAISTDLKKELLKLGVAEQQIYMVYNPVQTQRPKMELAQDEKTHFVYVGRLREEQKNITELFKALENLTNYDLAIYGDGRDRDFLENEAKKLGVNVTFYGWKDHPWEEIKNINYLVSTSNYEGFGMSISEAITRGVPVISSNCPVGPNDLIQDGKNGFLYPLNDVASLHTLLEQCMHKEYTWNQETIQHSLDYFSKEEYIQRVMTSLEQFNRY